MSAPMSADERRHVIWGPVRLWAGLMALFGATVFYAYLPGAGAKLGVSLSIGTAKALLIAMLFMQLRAASGLVRLAALAGLVWASFLYLFAFADYLTR